MRQKKDDSTPCERILREQEDQLRERRRQRREAEVADRQRAELRAAWDGAASRLAPDSGAISPASSADAPPASAVPALARLSAVLAGSGLLDRLSEPPAGVEGEDREAWEVAAEILRASADRPAEAAGLLGRVRVMPFAPAVRDWLVHGFRIVTEGRWQAGPLCVEMMRPLNPATPHAEVTVPPADGEPSLTPEDAAVLKVLLLADPVRMTVGKIEGKVTVSEKTIRNRLKRLGFLGLVERPEPKKGHRLTARGRTLAEKLAQDAGATLLRRTEKPAGR
jgi:hypothetical protein